MVQVLFNICDSYIRRNEGAERVIGTLLGRCCFSPLVVCYVGLLQSFFEFAREETTDARDCALSYGRLERMWMMFPWYTSDAYVIHTRALPTSLSSLW